VPMKRIQPNWPFHIMNWYKLLVYRLVTTMH
jgi:hypothetical protein